MKKFKNKKVLTIAAIFLVLAVSVGLAGAFFSDYDHALGQATFSLGGNTVIEEQVQDLEKTITIHNKGDGEVYVRVSVYGPDGMDVRPGEGWSGGNGVWYYQDVLPAGGDTTSIVASVKDLPVTVDLSEFDIIVTHVSVPVVYDADGNADYDASWAAANGQ